MRRSTFQWTKKGFSVKRGEAIQWMRGLVRMSIGKATQWRGSGHSLNSWTMKTEKLLSSSPSRKSALFSILVFFCRKTSTIHISNFCSGMFVWKVHELTFLWFGLPGPLLLFAACDDTVACPSRTFMTGSFLPAVRLFKAPKPPKGPGHIKNTTEYHYTQNDYRTELYYFSINFGNSCSVITEPNCFWNYLGSVRSVSTGLPNSRPNSFGNAIR